MTQLCIATALILSACGGGGGGTLSSPGTATVLPPTPNTEPFSGPPYSDFSAQDEDGDDFDSLVASFETTEYNSLGALDLINASSAYARGATGAEVRVGVIDSGVYEEHFEFRSGLSDKVDIVNSDYGPTNPRSNDAISHGTMVAGVIAANRDNANASFNMHGVAFDARIRAYEIPLGSGDGPYRPVDENNIDFGADNYFAERFTSMADQVDIINLSFGFSGVVTSYSTTSINGALSQTINALRQKDTSLGNRTIFVISAGNAFDDMDQFDQLVNASSPELLPGLPYLFPELQDHMVAVVATDNSGVISSFSNRCGVAADFCLAAPGGGDADSNEQLTDNEVIWSATAPPDNGESSATERAYYGGGIGTSFAAPLVSGSLALLKQMFPTVGNHEILNRLLITANSTGIYADRTIYGHGLLDLDAATRPVGALSNATGASLDQGMVNIQDVGINTFGSALGDSLIRSLSNVDMAVFDQLGFPFYQPASAIITSATHLDQIPNSTPIQHRSQQSRDGTKIQLGITADWQQHLPSLSQPNNQPQRDYIALHFQETGTTERFAGLNANPGWFFGLYANSVLTPASTANDSSFVAPWLRYARQGWSSGGAVTMGTDSKLRLGLFSGTASWDKYQTNSKLQSNGALLEYALLSSPERINSPELMSSPERIKSPERRNSPKLQGNAGLSIQTGYLIEQDSFLGTSIGPALGNIDQSDTFFVGINGHLQLSPQWQGLVALYKGSTRAGFEDSMSNPQINQELGQGLNLDNSISSSAWALGLRGNSLLRENDQLSLYISQPLRIQAGSGTVRLASGRTIDRRITYTDVAFDLQPRGREHQLEIGYHLPWKIGHHLTWLSANADYIHQPNHSRLNRDQFSLTLTFSIAIE